MTSPTPPSTDRIDLHAHTTRSDGTVLPADLVRLAAEVGLRAVAVTDHDTTAGWAEAEAAGAAVGVEVIRGIEITAHFPARAMHVLAYAFDPDEPRFAALLRRIRAGRDERNPRILARLAELGVPVTMDEVCAEAGGGTVGRPHIARALVRRGHVPDARAAFGRFLKDGGPAFVEAESAEPEEVLAAVRGAGGVAVLAHPKQLRVPDLGALRALLARLAEAGLSGVEVEHPSHDAAQREAYRRLARETDLVASGGSDFHGANKPDIRLGVGDGTISMGYETWEALRARRAASAS